MNAEAELMWCTCNIQPAKVQPSSSHAWIDGYGQQPPLKPQQPSRSVIAFHGSCTPHAPWGLLGCYSYTCAGIMSTDCALPVWVP